MKKEIILTLLIILSSIVAGAYQRDKDLESYPAFLFDMATGEREGEYFKTLGGTQEVHFSGSIIMSDTREFPETNSANYLSNQLPDTKFLWLNPAGENSGTRVPEQDFAYALKKVSEIEDIATMNTVLIGMPCTNHIVQELLNINKENCASYLKPNEAKIVLYQHGITGFYATLIITAGSPEALFEAAKKFHELSKSANTAKQFKGQKETMFKFPQIVQVKTTEVKKEVRDATKMIEQQKINRVKDIIIQEIKKVKKKLFLL